ncbi:hypothetical protein [Rhodococcus sp. SMB37]|nr:hypothetical protein [Rhodococcus sp. SMB37]
MSRDCTCARISYWHEPHCDIFWPDDDAESHLELLLDSDREDSL